MQRHDYPRRGSRALSGVLFVTGLLFIVPGHADDRYDDRGCDGKRSISLVNGRIHTMDGRDRVVSSVLIENGKFARVGGYGDRDGCSKEINLRGRTVVPGIIDNHNHIILLGLRPGNDVRLDRARTVGQALELLADKAKDLKPGEWVVSLGGIGANQFLAPTGERRFPNYAELNAALPKNPVFMFESFAGPSRTNELGKAFFESKGVPVNADGTIAGGFPTGPSLAALQTLRDLPEHNNLDAQVQGLLDALEFGLSVGVTTHVDQGSFHFAESYYGNTGTPLDGLASFDQYRAFDSVRALHAAGELPARVQINYLHQDSTGDTPQLEQRLNNTVSFLGDEWLSNGGIGEFTGGNPFAFLNSEPWINGTRLVAMRGWRNENHSLSRTDFMTILDFWAQVNNELKTSGIAQTPANPAHPPVVNSDGITKLRWVVAHVPFITEPYIDLAKELGVGLSVLGGWRWLSGSPTGNGPPFRTILARGVRAGMSSDGMQISVMDPWIGMYYAVTGKNAAGVVINGDETITRKQVLRLYTADNAWFLGPEWEKHLGSIEEGKWADLVVLSDDYFKVPDEEIPNIHSVLTVVNGKIVHDELDGKKKPHRKWRHDYKHQWFR
jgi:predicted amidohydrolase YtcJ